MEEVAVAAEESQAAVVEENQAAVEEDIKAITEILGLDINQMVVQAIQTKEVAQAAELEVEG